jgi:hypothetical protein
MPAGLQWPLLVIVLFAVLSLCGFIVLLPDGRDREQEIQHVEHALQAKTKEYSVVVERADQQLRSTVRKKREQFARALDSLSTAHLPGRLRLLRDKHQIVGERLGEIKAGKETVHEVLNAGSDPNIMREVTDKPPMRLDEIIDYLDKWIHGLHDALTKVKKAPYEAIWEAYHDYTVKTLYPWDREYLSRMPPRRDDGSIFLSLATYRDENCLNTIQWAYEKAKNPDKLFVGLVQQNCHKWCMSGILDATGRTEPVEPDQDCYQAFCDGEGKKYCESGQVRVLNIDEPESLGPYAARYFASKMWFGEQWFMQTVS